MHTAYIDGHQLSLETNTYLTLAASVAADQQETAVAMLRSILRTGALNLADLWSRFTHATYQTGSTFDDRARSGDTEPYLALLLEYSAALTLDQRGYSFQLRSHDQTVRHYLTAAEEIVLVHKLPAWGARGHVIRGVTSTFAPHTEATLETLALTSTIVDDDDLEDWFGTRDAVVLLTAHHRDDPSVSTVKNHAQMGARA